MRALRLRHQTCRGSCGLNLRWDCTPSWLCPPSPLPATFPRPQLFLLETPSRTLSQLWARILSVVHAKFLHGCERLWGWGEEGEYVVGVCPVIIRSPQKQTQVYRVKICHHTLAQSFSNFSMYANPRGPTGNAVGEVGPENLHFCQGPGWSAHCWWADHILSSERTTGSLGLEGQPTVKENKPGHNV